MTTIASASRDEVIEPSPLSKASFPGREPADESVIMLTHKQYQRLQFCVSMEKQLEKLWERVWGEAVPKATK